MFLFQIIRNVRTRIVQPPATTNNEKKPYRKSLANDVRVNHKNSTAGFFVNISSLNFSFLEVCYTIFR